jgi:pyruvate dehydrogenase E2 component (dihydrolipoamide acetyltransferase)
MSEFKMPSLGADMEAGTLIQWLKHPGDALKRGDIIAVVDTQKGAIEIEVFEDGVLEKTVVPPGERVPVGTVLAVIRHTGEAESRPAAPLGAPAVSTAPPARLRASPAARKRAESLGVDLTRVHGSGAGGAITSEDVERAAHAAAAVPQPAVPAGRAGMRTAIAAAMSRAKREIPHYYLSTTIDMSATLGWLRAENERRSVADRLLMIAVLVKAVATALREVPELNGHWIDGAFRAGTGIHIGCAIALRGGGLVAPAVHDADRKDVSALMREVSDLVARARAGSLKSSELSDATITITNLGDQGVDAGFGIIYPPQVALVGFGRILERPWVVAGAIEPRATLTATLSADHRASDGHRGGLFLTALDRLLQKPEHL